MGSIELVIKIPEEMYKWVNDVNKCFDDYGTSDFIDLVKNGIPIPKGHDRLIDVNNLLNYGACPNSCKGTATCANSYEHLHCPLRVFDIESINDALTIIEADKEIE